MFLGIVATIFFVCFIRKKGSLNGCLVPDIKKLDDAKLELSKFSGLNGLDLAKKVSTKKENDGKLHFITVARFSNRKKGFDLIQKVCSKLIEKKINFKWKIIGIP